MHIRFIRPAVLCAMFVALVVGCVSEIPGIPDSGAGAPVPDWLCALGGCDFESLCALTGDPYWCNQVPVPEPQGRPVPDMDGDEVLDNVDNCPLVYNPGQEDCDGDAVGDACQGPDCNGNGVPDECEIGEAPAHDCCQTDHGEGCNDPDIEACVCAVDPYCCDGEWDSDCVAEVDRLDCGTCVIAGDCNGNGLLDACDVLEGTSPDCNGNDLPDDCDIALCPSDTFSCDDCNDNGVPDDCDIADETSDDCNANGRPDECDATITAIRLAQESAPGVGDFGDHVLGFVEPFGTTLSAADFYRYSLGSAASFNGPAPPLTFERSHLFMVQATDGLSLFVVHDRPGNADGGYANTRYELSGDADAVSRTVEDDTSDPDSYGGAPGATVFTANHGWSPCCTDGLALTGFDGIWSLTMEFTSSVTGMNSWAAYSPDQEPIMLALVRGRRVQLQVVTDPGVADCNENSVLDACDIAAGTSLDENANGVPDECEPG